MPSPIGPDDFEPTSWGGSACEKFRSLIATNERLNTFMDWLLDDDLEISDAAIASFQDRVTPVGAILIWGSGSLPSDKWKICDGQAVSRTTYLTLFQRLGTTFGVGDGTNTFNLPNMQGQVPIGVNPDALGASVGARGVELDTTNLPAHTHTLATKKLDEIQIYGSAELRVEAIGFYDNGTDTPFTATAPTTGSTVTGSTGSATEVSVLQPSTALYFIMKVT